jgi:uncharacterized protein YciI
MLGLLAGLITVFPHQATPPKMVKMQMVFFRHSTKIPGISRLKQRELQQKHWVMLNQLLETKKAVSIGRFEDKSYEGVAVIDAPDERAATEILKDDPLVSLGIVNLDIIPWYFVNLFHAATKPAQDEKIWFGILERPKNAPQYPATKLDELQKGHIANIGKMAEGGILAGAGPLEAKDNRRGIFIFFSKDIGTIKRAVAVDPLIKAKRLELKLMPWWTGKGTIVQYKSN